MLFIGEKVGLAAKARRHGVGLPEGRHRRRSARGHEPLRDRRARTRSPCSPRPTRAACCTRPISTWRSWSSGPSSKHAVSLDAPVAENLQRDRAMPRARRRGPRRHRARPPAAREADRGHPRDRRADPADRRRRPVGRHRGGGRRQRRARGDGHRRRAGRRAHRRRDALPERRDLRAARRRRSRSTRSAAARWASPTSSGSTRRRTSRPATNIIFAATGVTDGALMKGVRFFGDGIRTSSLVMQSKPARIRFIDTIHVEQARTVESGSDRLSTTWHPGSATSSRSPPRASSASPASRW